MDSEIYKIIFDFQSAGIPELTDLTSKLNQIKNNNTQASTTRLEQVKGASSNLSNNLNSLAVGTAVGNVLTKEKMTSVGQSMKKVETASTKENTKVLELNKELVKVKSELKQSAVQINSLQAEVRNTQEKVGSLIMEKDAISIKANSRISELTNGITDLKQKSEFDIKGLNSEIGGLEKKLENATSQIKKRDNTIRMLQNQIDRMRGEEFLGSNPSRFTRNAWKNKRQRGKMNKPQRGRAASFAYDGVSDVMNNNQRTGS